jgi:hypothetical protein
MPKKLNFPGNFHISWFSLFFCLFSFLTMTGRENFAQCRGTLHWAIEISESGEIERIRENSKLILLLPNWIELSRNYQTISTFSEDSLIKILLKNKNLSNLSYIKWTPQLQKLTLKLQHISEFLLHFPVKPQKFPKLHRHSWTMGSIAR